MVVPEKSVEIYKSDEKMIAAVITVITNPINIIKCCVLRGIRAMCETFI